MCTCFVPSPNFPRSPIMFWEESASIEKSHCSSGPPGLSATTTTTTTTRRGSKFFTQTSIRPLFYFTRKCRKYASDTWVNPIYRFSKSIRSYLHTSFSGLAQRNAITTQACFDLPSLFSTSRTSSISFVEHRDHHLLQVIKANSQIVASLFTTPIRLKRPNIITTATNPLPTSTHPPSGSTTITHARVYRPNFTLHILAPRSHFHLHQT
jgi:hypothetical protein